MTRTLIPCVASRRWLIAVLLLAMHLAAPTALLAQDDETSGPVADQAAREGVADDEAGAEASEEAGDASNRSINVLDLFVSGGWLMARLRPVADSARLMILDLYALPSMKPGTTNAAPMRRTSRATTEMNTFFTRILRATRRFVCALSRRGWSKPPAEAS